MARFKKLPQKKEGKIVYCDGIIDGIVVLSLAEMPYVELYSSIARKNNQSNSVKVAFEKDGINIDVYVKIHYTQSISDMAFKIQESVRHHVEAMTEYHISSVNIIVKGLLFDSYNENTQNEQKYIKNDDLNLKENSIEVDLSSVQTSIAEQK